MKDEGLDFEILHFEKQNQLLCPLGAGVFKREEERERGSLCSINVGP